VSKLAEFSPKNIRFRTFARKACTWEACAQLWCTVASTHGESGVRGQPRHQRRRGTPFRVVDARGAAGFLRVVTGEVKEPDKRSDSPALDCSAIPAHRSFKVDADAFPWRVADVSRVEQDHPARVPAGDQIFKCLRRLAHGIGTGDQLVELESAHAVHVDQLGEIFARAA
jgi:hypothetical protein